MTDTLVWPHHILGYKATPTQARKLAEELKTIFGFDLDLWLRLGRFEVKKEVKDAGGLEALCIPMNNDRFRFVIFIKNNKHEHPFRQTFLILHEIAHTFFYIRAANQRPKRALASNSLTGGNDWEEKFCDMFAQTLIGYTYKEVGLSKHDR